MNTIGLYDAWVLWKGCCLHFSKDDFDGVQFHFRGPKISAAKLQKHYAQWGLMKLASCVRNKDEFIDLIIGNIVYGDITNPNEMDEGPWKAMNSSIARIPYTFEKDMKALCDKYSNLSQIFEVTPSGVPNIYSDWLQDTISFETLVVLESLNPWVSSININDLMQQEVFDALSLRIRKFSAYIKNKLDLNRLKNITLNIYTTHSS